MNDPVDMRWEKILQLHWLRVAVERRSGNTFTVLYHRQLAAPP